MDYEVEFTDEFGEWWDTLSIAEQVSIEAVVDLLEEHGPRLRYPHSSGIHGSRHSHMRELRIQHHGRPYRILYAFDPRRTAILLIGGDKTGRDRWYEWFISPDTRSETFAFRRTALASSKSSGARRSSPR